MTAAATPAGIMAFWREAGPDLWFTLDDAFDRVVRARFLVVHEAAAAGQLADWQETREGALAFCSTSFRATCFVGKRTSFATDAMGRGVTDLALARGYRFGDAPFFSASICRSCIRRRSPIRIAAFALPQSADLNKMFCPIKPGGKSGEFAARAFARPWLSGWPHPKP